jgi:hypothetical protein
MVCKGKLTEDWKKDSKQSKIVFTGCCDKKIVNYTYSTLNKNACF